MTLEPWPKQQPQRQDSLAAQLTDLHVLAARYGMYDAADWLWKRMPKMYCPSHTPGRTGADTTKDVPSHRLLMSIPWTDEVHPGPFWDCPDPRCFGPNRKALDPAGADTRHNEKTT